MDSNFAPENFTEKELKWAYWFVTHKLLLKRVLVIFLIVFSVITLSYSLYGLLDYFLISGPLESSRTAAMIKSLVSPQSLQKIKPLPLKIGSVSVLSSGSKYDFVVEISNPNPKWRAEFDYKFQSPDFKSEIKRGFILPLESKFIVFLAQESKARPRNIEFKLEKIFMHRISPHQIPDYKLWSEERLNIIADEAKFVPRSGEGSYDKVSFALNNKTAYGFWQIGMPIVLFRDNSIIAVNYLSADKVGNGARRPLVVSWFEPLPFANKIVIKPEVNIFDPAVYMPIQ